MPAFQEDYPGSVAIPTITVEWKKPSVNGLFTGTQFSLNLNGHSLSRKVGDKCSGLTLVALSKVRMFKHFLFWDYWLLNDYARSTLLLVWLILIMPLLQWKKMPLIQDFIIQPSFKTNASFLSLAFTDIIFNYLSDFPGATGNLVDYAYYVNVILNFRGF